MKKLPIKHCRSCPHRTVTGHDELAFIPVCMSARQQLPFDVVDTEDTLSGKIARSTDVIPEWCPLEDY